MVVGASFDTVEDQRAFADREGFPFRLISDPDRTVGRAYHAERAEGEDYYEHGVPRRISYLISPDGSVAKAYDLAGQDLHQHAAEIVADIKTLSRRP